MMPDMFSLENKVVVVTGAAGHLGHAMSVGLAEAGATLALCSTDLAKAEKVARELADEFGCKATGFKLDLRDADSIGLSVDTIAKQMGRIDALVNNACYAKYNELESISEEEWSEGLAGGATGPFLLLQACIPYLEKSKGSVVNISSMYGMVSPDPKNYLETPFGSSVNYGAAKAALLQVTRYASAYLGSKDVRVNSISPGPFPNPEVQKNEKFIDRLSGNTALGRIGKPDEIKGAVIFLVSDASSYVTGHNLVVDGGWTAW